MQPKTFPDIISGRLYQLGRADLHNYLQPWSTMPSFDREVAALPRDTGKGGREWTQLGWPEPQFALILLHILLHPFSCNSVIALSKSFLIDVSYCSLERRRAGTTVHSLRQGLHNPVVACLPNLFHSTPLPLVGRMTHLPSRGHAYHFFSAEHDLFLQCPTAIILLTFQNPVHVPPFLFLWFFRAQLQWRSFTL